MIPFYSVHIVYPGADSYVHHCTIGFYSEYVQTKESISSRVKQHLDVIGQDNRKIYPVSGRVDVTLFDEESSVIKLQFSFVYKQL